MLQKSKKLNHDLLTMQFLIKLKNLQAFLFSSCELLLSPLPFQFINNLMTLERSNSNFVKALGSSCEHTKNLLKVFETRWTVAWIVLAKQTIQSRSRELRKREKSVLNNRFLYKYIHFHPHAHPRNYLVYPKSMRAYNVSRILYLKSPYLHFFPATKIKKKKHFFRLARSFFLLLLVSCLFNFHIF